MFRFRDLNPVSKRVKVRVIGSPNEAMRVVHRHFIEHLRDLEIDMPSATACREGSSAVKSVMRHLKRGRRSFNRYVVLLDISSAYQSARIDRMLDALASVSPDIAASKDETREFLLANFFDEGGGLVTGGPASPDLFNIYCEVHIDRTLRALCAGHGIVYTRYLDDLMFSSRTPIGHRKRQSLRAVVESVGFRISDRKAETIDLRKGAAVVNGVGLTLEGRLFLPGHMLRNIRGLLHVGLTKGTVKPSIIHGKMGLLGGIIRFNAGKTESEKRVIQMYREYQRLQRARRAGQ